MYCPICNSNKFTTDRAAQRRLAQGIVSERSVQKRQPICAGCGSRPRTRLIYAIIERHGLIKPGMNVLHIAAEKALVSKLSGICGDGYHIANLSMNEMKDYTGVKKVVFDMCATAPNERYDLILHSHVLEHVYCNWAIALTRLNRMLTPTGSHVFCIPMNGDEQHYKEDLDPSLPADQRVEQFGQSDHVRNFVVSSFPSELAELAELTNCSLQTAADLVSAKSARRIGASGFVFVMKNKNVDAGQAIRSTSLRLA